MFYAQTLWLFHRDSTLSENHKYLGILNAENFRNLLTVILHSGNTVQTRSHVIKAVIYSS